MPKKPEEKKRELSPIQKDYSLTFSPMHGQRVMADFLVYLKWHDDIVSEEDRIKHNIAKYLLDMCGGWQTKIHGIHK